jgi:type II secretory pathway pseudopilin PulG
MIIFPQPCLALPNSPKLRAKQAHATSRHGLLLSHPSCKPSGQSQDSRVLKFHHPKSKIQNPKFGGSAFSLTEVVIAMGVAAVAFTSIIALFPLGLNMSKESYEATQAALIAQTILADVNDQQTGSANLRTPDVFNSRQIQIANNSDPQKTLANYITVPINEPTQIQTVYIAYKPFTGTSDTDPNNPSILRPAGGQLNGAAGWYTNGSNGCFALVKATFSPTFRYSSATNSTATRLDLSIETPGSANISNRTCFLFTSAFRP